MAKAKKIRNTIIWSVLIIYLVVMLGVVRSKYKQIPYKTVNITFANKVDNVLLEKADISKILNQEKKIVGSSFDSISIPDLEHKLKMHPAISNVNIYKRVGKDKRDIYGKLYVEVYQRNPIVRIIDQEKNTYYLGDNGDHIPVYGRFVARVVVASGNIPGPIDSLGMRKQVLNEVYLLAKHINDNNIWKAQIEQIFVNDRYEYELIPLVGSHIVHFGGIENYKSKFEKLNAAYRVGLANNGWNKYRAINLKYKNQVICEKK